MFIHVYVLFILFVSEYLIGNIISKQDKRHLFAHKWFQILLSNSFSFISKC